MKQIRYGYFKDGKFVDCGDKPTKDMGSYIETYPVKQVTKK
jgi:hypothetical protein